MDSTLKWNTTCEIYSSYEDLVAAAKIIELSIIEDISLKLSGDTALISVHVYELCNVYLDHGGTTTVNNARRLQVGVLTTDIKIHQIISKKCTNCSDDMFDESSNALNEIVDEGILTKSIQDNSQGRIKAVINPNNEPVASDYITMTASPTVTPGSPSSSPSSRPSRTPITLSPVTISPNRPTSFPTASKTKSSKKSKSTKATLSPATHTPVTLEPTASKASKDVKNSSKAIGKSGF
jgi:hypothetical protein|eukprot:scaffold81745_cov53-Cyclotella_meneghiniana.AAC.1